MNAVWSFWSKPWDDLPGHAWDSSMHHFLSWILSFETARKHYPKTHLVTDTNGARILSELLGLEFDSISTHLDCLDCADPRWWALGKIYAYRMQEEPFVHIDSDVYMWEPLSPELETSSVIAQNPEYFTLGKSWYHPEKFMKISRSKGWLPEELDWFIGSGKCQKAECCGIFGGCDLDFIRFYANRAINLVEHPVNSHVWSQIGGDNILVEQYYLSACLEYYRSIRGNRFADIDIGYVFESSEEAFRPGVAESVGFTHLIGGAKRNSSLLERLSRRVERDYPLQYEHCMKYFSSSQ